MNLPIIGSSYEWTEPYDICLFVNDHLLQVLVVLVLGVLSLGTEHGGPLLYLKQTGHNGQAFFALSFSWNKIRYIFMHSRGQELATGSLLCALQWDRDPIFPFVLPDISRVDRIT